MRRTAAGALWTRQRKHEAGLIDSPICLRCGGEEEDEGHRFWRCPANKGLGNSNIQSTEGLVEEACQGQEEEACFWNRGLVPSKWTKVPEAPNYEPVRTREAL